MQLRLNDIKKKGANRFGSLIEKFTFDKDLVTIGDKQYRMEELKNLEIDATDFLGKTNDFFVPSSGTDNFIDFRYGDTDFSYQFQIKSRGDIKLLSEILKAAKFGVTSNQV